MAWAGDVAEALPAAAQEGDRCLLLYSNSLGHHVRRKAGDADAARVVVFSAS